MNRKIFRYNMSFYYQSTIIYFIAAILYFVIRGEFIEGQYVLVLKDPIIYFFGLIILISIISLLYNLYKNRHLEITDDAILFTSRFRTRKINFDDIKKIRLFREKGAQKNKALRLVTIALKSRRRLFILRPYDYENELELINLLRQLKTTKNL